MPAYKDKNLYDRIIARQGEMEHEREPLEPDCDKIISIFRPDMVKFSRRTEGQKGILGANIHEGTGPWALRLMSDGIQGNLVSPSIPWLRYGVDDKRLKGNDEVNQWLQAFEEQMISVYRENGSDFYASMGPYTRHGLAVGSPVILPEVDKESGKIQNIIPHPATRYFKQNRFGKTDVLHLKHEWTIDNAVSTFKLENLSKSVQHQYENGTHGKVTIIRGIYFYLDRIFKDLPDEKNGEGYSVIEGDKENTYKTFTPRWPWVSIYVEEGRSGEAGSPKKPLRIEGYFSKPFSVWHYEKDQSEIYSRTPAWFSYYDTKSANNIRKGLMMASQRAVEKAWWAPDYLKGILKTYPRGINWFNLGQAKLKPEVLDDKANYPFGIDIEDRFVESVKRHFHVKMWIMVSIWAEEKKAPPTATQIIQMAGEKAVLIGPRVGPFLTTLGEIDTRYMDIEDRRGRLPEPPDELLELTQGNVKVNPEFIGPLAQLQKMYLSIRKIESGLASLEPVLKIDPMVVHKIKAEELAEYILEEHNFPQHLIRNDDEYQEIVSAIAQQAAEDRMLQMGVEAAKAVPSVSKDVEPNSPIAGLLEGAA